MIAIYLVPFTLPLPSSAKPSHGFLFLAGSNYILATAAFVSMGFVYVSSLSFWLYLISWIAIAHM